MNKPIIDGRIKFRHLQCFLAVAQHATLQKAAVALSISQPAVSKTIKELEDILNVKLFERGRRGAEITPQAEIFATYAEAAVQALQQAANFMGPARKPVNPVMKIGATPAMAASFVPQALMAFRRRMPTIQVSILTGTTSYLMEQLREREFDLVLCRHLDPEQMAGLSFEYLYADPLVVVVRPGHPLLAPDQVTPLPKTAVNGGGNGGGGAGASDSGAGAFSSDAGNISPALHLPRQYTAILPPKTSINRRAAAPLAMALNLGPITDFIESLSISFGRIYTVNSDAIWFVPWSAVKLDVENGAMVKLTPLTKSGDEAVGLVARTTGLMMRSNFVATPEMQVLIGAIRECAAGRRTEIF
jgi:LysR family pca operon transcriptional activator